MSFVGTVVCDSCETEYVLSEDMEMPPSWLGVQVIIADREGIIPMHEKENYMHFCSQDCLVDYASDKKFKERILMADKEEKDGDTE